MNPRLRALLQHPRWRRLAQFGFWFFFIKGLLWLLLPALLLWWGLAEARCAGSEHGVEAMHGAVLGLEAAIQVPVPAA